MNLKGRSFLKLLDYTPEEILYLVDLAAELKDKKKKGILTKDKHAGKNVALIFEKTSTRTRCSFEVAAYDLGMNVTYLEPTGSQIGKKETIADTARVLGRIYDGILFRGFSQKTCEELAEYSGVPVWNGLTNEFHPTQILADFLTIKEHFGSLNGIKLVYMGDARYNMGNSLMVGCAKMGMHFVACAPANYMPDADLIETCRAIAAETGAVLEFISDPMVATKNADVIYTDVWVSMGEPDAVWQERIDDLLPYQVNNAVMIEGDIEEKYYIKPEEREQGKTSPYAFRVKKIMLLGNVTDTLLKGFAINISTTMLSPEFREKLVKLLKANKGNTPLTMFLTDPEKGWKIEFLSRKFTVAVTAPLLEELDKMQIKYNPLKK